MRGLTFIETIIVALITVIITSLLTNYLQRRSEQIKFLRDKLIDRYSEFVATASAELDRAKMQKSTALSGQEGQDYTDLIQSTHQLMRSNRAQLNRLSLQIRLFEQDDLLNKMVQEITKDQPVMMFLLPPEWKDSSYNERFNKFDSEINLFEQNLSDLVNLVLTKHSKIQKENFIRGCFKKVKNFIRNFIHQHEPQR